jgi:two-component system cell cycle sensor histidine kinase/response regulator CckA
MSLGPGLPMSLLRRTPYGIVLIAGSGTIVWANPAYFETTGRSPSLLGTDFHDIPETDGSWSTSIREAVDSALRSGDGVTFCSVRACSRDRSAPVYLDVDVRALSSRGREPRRVLLIIRDVTDRVEEHERAALFYESFRSSTNVMQLTDASGIMIDVNPAFERVYGYARDECIGRKPSIVRSDHTRSEVYDTMWNDLLDPERGYWSGEILNRDRNGRELPMLLGITAIRDATSRVTHYLGVAVDLSEQRSWEFHAAHADKLAIVGQLAAGVAHEINTPLANVLLVAESVRRRTSDPWILSRLDRMSAQVEVAAGIVRGLLDFARRDEPRTGHLDIVEVAKESVAFIQGKQPTGIEIEEVYPAAVVPVLGDRGQLMQVLSNIVNNACDAMQGTGTIRVSVRQHGSHAEIEVLDHGPGIAPEALSHIFEPFYTTKPERKGTGLGLAICHGIVQAHHGEITARNVAGAGARFLVSLPLEPLVTVPTP